MTEKRNKLWLAWCAPLTATAMVALPAMAGTLNDDVLVGTSGDGAILADADEGVVEPGIKAVTFTRTRVDDPDNPGEFLFLDPFPAFETDFTGLPNRGSVTNCLMASNPDVFCDSEGGSGKRIKTLLTGRNPFDMVLSTTPGNAPGETTTFTDADGLPAEIDTSAVDYFTFGKVENFTGARVTGFSIELLAMDGTPMGELDAESAVLFNLDATDVGLGGRLVDGLFGAGGQEGEIGFFTTDTATPEATSNRAGFSRTDAADVLDFGPVGTPLISQTDYTTFFGDAFLPDNVVPDGLFWDDNNDPSDESALVAWNNIAGGGFTYGSLASDANITARLGELATALGVDPDDLSYTPGGLVPEDIVALAEANGLFGVDKIEDLRNANLNYTFTVGNVEDGEFIVRYAPRFVELVEETETASQFRTAASLDLANVPFIASEEDRQPYLDLIDELIAFGDVDADGLAAQNLALDSMGFNFLETYTGLAFGIVQEQIYALSTPADLGRPGGASISTQGGNWRSLGNNLDAFLAIAGSSGDVDPNGANAGYDFDTYSVTAGLATALNETLSAGIMVGYGDGEADIDNGFGKVEVDGASVAGFVQGRFANDASLRAFLGYQDLSFDSSRNIFIPGNPVQTASGDTDGSVFFAGLTGDLPVYKTETFDFGLMAAVEYYDTEIDGYTETGAGILNLTVGDQSTDTTVARLGVRARGVYGNLRPYGHLAWATRNGDDLDVATSLGGVLPGSTQVAGADDDWLDLGLGLTVDTGKGGRLRAEYRGAYSDGYTNNTARLSYEIRF